MGRDNCGREVHFHCSFIVCANAQLFVVFHNPSISFLEGKEDGRENSLIKVNREHFLGIGEDGITPSVRSEVGNLEREEKSKHINP